jgi:hypothetical protein
LKVAAGASRIRAKAFSDRRLSIFASPDVGAVSSLNQLPSNKLTQVTHMLTKDEWNQQPQDLFEDLLDYFRERMDVKDGPNGQRLPNEEMNLYLRVNTAFVDLVRTWTNDSTIAIARMLDRPLSENDSQSCR